VSDAGYITLYRVVVASAPADREEEVARVVGSIRGAQNTKQQASPVALRYPIVVLRQASSAEAKEAGKRLKEAGATVSLQAYQSPALEGGSRKKSCPRCGSSRVQSFAFAAAPGANVKNTKCLECGALFHTNERTKA
jgi:ribosomal protein S27AE